MMLYICETCSVRKSEREREHARELSNFSTLGCSMKYVSKDIFFMDVYVSATSDTEYLKRESLFGTMFHTLSLSHRKCSRDSLTP